ncbi:WD40 repeat-containing protein [Synechococcus sp. PCC 7502]|nr:WD40 repeat-containing protein [Synechococcus sp. PCC 7502]
MFLTREIPVNKKFLPALALSFSLGLSTCFIPGTVGLNISPNLRQSSVKRLSNRLKLEVMSQFQGHQLTGEAIIHIHYSRDGRYLLSVATDGLAKLWATDGKFIRAFVGQPVAMVFNGAFSSDSSQIVTASYDGVARIWSLQGQVLRELRGHTSGVTDVKFLSEEQGIVSSSDDGTVRYWSKDGNNWFTVPKTGVSRNMDISPQGNLLAVTQDIGTITLLSSRGDIIRTIGTGQGRLNSVSFSADGKLIVTAGFDGTARVFTLDGKEIVKLKVLDKGWVTGAAFSRDKLIATVSDDGILRLWDLDGNLLDSFNPGLERLGSVAFHPDGKNLAIAAYHGTLILLKIK